MVAVNGYFLNLDMQKYFNILPQCLNYLVYHFS